MYHAMRYQGPAMMAALLVSSACVHEKPGVEGTQSLRITVLAPTDLGTVDRVLPDGTNAVTISVQAIDAQGQIDTSVNREVAVHVQFLATTTPPLGDAPLAKVALAQGQSPPTTITLPAVYGPTTLWLEDVLGEAPTYVAGASSTFWFRNPYIANLQRPADEAASTALTRSPLELKQVRVTQSRYGASGRLVVTSTFAQGYTVSDVQCADAAGAPPCVTGEYDHMLVFTYSRPKDTKGRQVVAGQAISGFTGGVTEFNGLTEMSFPTTIVDGSPEVNRARVPAPIKIDGAWFSEPIRFERAEAALVEFNQVRVCPLDDDYTRYKQWKVAVGGDCGERDTLINVITTGLAFDPAAKVGQDLPRLVGTLRPVSLSSRNIWIVYPRDEADLQLEAL